MTILTYTKDKRFYELKSFELRKNVLERKKKSFCLLKILLWVSFLAVTLFTLYIKNIQVTLSIKNSQLERKCELLKEENKLLAASYFELNSVDRLLDLAKNNGYQLKNIPIYLGSRISNSENNLVKR